MRRVGPLLLVLIMASPSVSVAADPWSFATRAERDQAVAAYRESYYYIQYQKAERLLQKGSADEAAVRLKLAIDADPASGTKKLPGGQTLDYFPYFLLAKAYAGKGDFAAAEACRNKESNAIAQSKDYRDDYLAFSRWLPQLAFKDELLAHGRTVLAWKGGGGKVVLTPEGAEGLTRIEALAAKLAGLGAADGEQVGTVSGQLRQEIVDLTARETKALTARLERLAADPWSGAFASDKALISGSLCQAASGAGGTDMARNIDLFARCNDAVLKATRIAGQWECERLSSLRVNVSAQSENLKRWVQAQGGAVPDSTTPPALPAACIDWGGAAVPEVSAAFAGLESQAPAVRQALTQLQGTINATFEQQVEQLVAQVGRFSSQLPEISNQCARVLQLGQSATQVGSLRSKLSVSRLSPSELPAPELFQAEKLVSSALQDLVTRVQAGAGELQKSGECQGMKRDNLDALPNALQAYLDRREQSGFGSLCAVAIRADQDIQTCWIGRIEEVRERVVRLDGMLDMTRAIPVASDERLGCLEVTRAGVRNARNAPVRDRAAWVQAARERLGEAQVCLKDLGQVTRESGDALLARVSELRSLLSPLANSDPALGSGATLPPAIERVVRSLLTEVEGMGARLSALSPLYSDPPETPGAALKPALEKAELLAGLPPQALDLLDKPEASRTEAEADFMPVIRDSAALPWLQGVNRRLDDLQPTVIKLGPFAALSHAFAVFQRSDLDQSILVLREARRKGHLPEQGRAAALVHAAMAYFVYSKARAVVGESDVKRSLEQDVRLEARMAKRADRSFALPQDLFPNRAFRKTFEEFAAAETGQEG